MYATPELLAVARQEREREMFRAGLARRATCCQPTRVDRLVRAVRAAHLRR